MQTITREQVGRALITITHDVVAGNDIWRVETLASGVYQHDCSRSFGSAVGNTVEDAHIFYGMVKESYSPMPDPSILLPPAPVVDRPEPRTGWRAALSNLTTGGWTTRHIATALKVTPQAVNRWKRGGIPNARNAEWLMTLSKALWSNGAGCGCAGTGVVVTGDTRSPEGRIVTAYQRCSTCNRKES